MPPAAFRWMTAEEWDTSTNLWLMLHNAEQLTSDQRKMSLFGVGCCRRHWSLLFSESQAVLEEFETLLDQLAKPSASAVTSAGGDLCARANVAVDLVRRLDPSNKRRLAAAKAVCYAVVGSAWGAYSHFMELDPREETFQVQLLRDIFGNPFRAVTPDLVWRTPTVLALANAAYNDRLAVNGFLDHARLSVLADAIEDAGCTHHAVLDHLHQPGPHVRGCWALDLLLSNTPTP